MIFHLLKSNLGVINIDENKKNLKIKIIKNKKKIFQKQNLKF